MKANNPLCNQTKEEAQGKCTEMMKWSWEALEHFCFVRQLSSCFVILFDGLQRGSINLNYIMMAAVATWTLTLIIPVRALLSVTMASTYRLRPFLSRSSKSVFISSARAGCFFDRSFVSAGSSNRL